MKLLLTIIGMLLILFIITFSLANFDPVHLKYYDFFDFQIPAYLLIFIAFGAGAIFVGFLDIVERTRLSRQVKKLKKSLKAYEKNVKKEEESEEIPAEEQKTEESLEEQKEKTEEIP